MLGRTSATEPIGPVHPAAPDEPLPTRPLETIFHHSSAVFGEFTILPDQPRLSRYEDVLLVGPALYDNRRQLITDSAFFRGVPSMQTMGAAYAIDQVPVRAAERLPPGQYFWLGPIHLHFGHFLVSTLARLWALPQLPDDAILLYPGGGPPDATFQFEYVRESFLALGITPARLRQVNGPLLIPAITVAQPSLVENFGASPAYIATLGRIRDAILPGRANPGDNAPVYISKERVPRGVRGIANEDEVTAILAREGVAIAHPDTLPFPEQLAFWCDNTRLIGFASSAFHMAGFGGGKKLCTIAHDHLASCNQVLIDRLAGNAHLYLHGGPELISLGPSDRFTDMLRIVDPVRFAHGILDLVGALDDLPGQRVGPEPRSVFGPTLNYDPFGANVARQGVALQSSVYEFDEGYSCMAAGALSFRLTGAYQACTRLEDEPWWQVELPTACRIHEVRIFNRCDNRVAQERLRRFRLSVSPDGEDWTEIHTHDGEAPGGAVGEPFRWQAQRTTVTRFVRITLLGRDYLNLDQVEVFGEALAGVKGGRETPGRFPL